MMQKAIATKSCIIWYFRFFKLQFWLVMQHSFNSQFNSVFPTLYILTLHIYLTSFAFTIYGVAVFSSAFIIFKQAYKFITYTVNYKVYNIKI